MIVAHVSAHFDVSVFLFGLFAFPREIKSCVLGGGQSALSTSEASRTSETLVVCVVGCAEDGDAGAIREAGGKDATGVAVFVAVSQIHVRNPRLIQFALCRDVKHGGLFAVVDAGLFGVVTLLVIRLNLIHQIRRQVLHGSLRVAFEEVFAVDEELGDGFSVPLDGSVVVHLHARQLFDE